MDINGFSAWRTLALKNPAMRIFISLLLLLATFPAYAGWLDWCPWNRVASSHLWKDDPELPSLSHEHDFDQILRKVIGSHPNAKEAGRLRKRVPTVKSTQIDDDWLDSADAILISKYLEAAGVDHVLVNTRSLPQIIILPSGESPLNQYAAKLSKEFHWELDFNGQPYSSSKSGHVNVGRNDLLDPVGSTDLKYIYRQLTATTSGIVSPEIVETWAPKNFTDPAHAKKGRFQYLVHAVRDVADLEHPENLSARPGLSSSVISSEKPGTFNSFGFILNCPQENIVATASHDIGSGGKFANGIGVGSRDVAERETSFKNLFKKWGISTPDEILRYTGRTFPLPKYNEIVIRGTSPSGKKITASGLFVKTKDGKPECDAATLEKLKELSASKKLPIVYIEDAP